MTVISWPRPFRYFRDARVFLFTLTAAIILVLSAIFFFRYQSVKTLMLESLKHEAVTYTNQIILTRSWNARHGGVYVLKRPGVESNRYLKQVGIEPDIHAANGDILTLRNPAAMTRELSELSGRENSVRFRLISLRAVNPANEPDEFERKALETFERGITSSSQLVSFEGRPVFRYLSPLMVEKPCLTCHANQGYRIGDVRGGISVYIPAESLLAQLRKNRNEIILVTVFTIGTLIAIVYFMTWKLLMSLGAFQTKLELMAITDELTGLKNRRFIMEQFGNEYQRAVRSGAPLSVIMLDIDHFKRINDTHGHACGDHVLRSVSATLQGSLRTYDLLGRVGGEEFLIASPGSTLDEATALAGRILDRLRASHIAYQGSGITVTASAGVTSLGEQDPGIDALLARADAALYLAKQEGRDRVVTV